MVLALMWFISDGNMEKRSVTDLKSLQLENLLQFQSALKSVQSENSTLHVLESADKVLPLEGDLQKPEDLGEEDTIDHHRKKGGKKEANAALRRLRTRREKVVELCRSGKFQDCYIEPVLTYRMFFFHRYNTSVCTLAKSASSTWRAQLRRVNGGPPFNKSTNNDNIRNAFLQRPIEHVLKDVKSSSKIITVRHPLTRLVSAFRNKYNNGNFMTPHKPLAEAEYRKRIAGSSWAERFYQFWLPALVANNMVPPNTHLAVGMKAPIDPSVLYSEEEYVRLYQVLKPKVTFVHFLRFVLKTYEEGKPDAHWVPYYECCCPCYYDYEYITKVETLSEDLEYIFKKLSIPADPHTSMNQLRESDDNVYSYLKYYRKVPATLRREIYKYLKPDMDLFGYELHKKF